MDSAPPNAILNITATLGTILTDARPELLGNQVVADNTGHTSFQIRRPFVDGNSKITVTDFTGAAFGSATQQYTLPVTRKLDMNYQNPSLPDSSWLDVRSSSLYSASAGYGWTSAPNATDAGTYPSGSTVAQQGLYRD